MCRAVRPTFSMSLARKHFCELTARRNGGSACPRKYGMHWFIPALVNISPDSGGGINDELGTRLCPRSSKNRRNVSRILLASIERSLRSVQIPDHPCTAILFGCAETVGAVWV